MTKTLRNKKAFTLTELIVVIAVIGILAAVLIPSLTGYISKAKQSAAEQEAASVFEVYKSWQIETEDPNAISTISTIDGSSKPAKDVFSSYYTSVTNKTVIFTEVNGNNDGTGFTGFTMKVSSGKTITVTVANDGKVTYGKLS